MLCKRVLVKQAANITHLEEKAKLIFDAAFGIKIEKRVTSMWPAYLLFRKAITRSSLKLKNK